MRPTDVLRTEHEQILRGCAVLEAMATSIDSGTPVGAEDARAIVDFVRFYADGLHHAKEEHVLFPALVAAGLPRNGGPIAVMLFEHERGRGLVEGMQRALSSLDTPQGRSTFATNARGFAVLLEQHIGKENMILFAMADRMLPAARDAELFGAYAAREEAAHATCGDKASREAALAVLAGRWS